MAALDACDAFDPALGGLSSVAGFAFVADLAKAVPYGLDANSPKALEGGAGWIVQFHGERPQVRAGQSWIDEMCVYSHGEPAFVATGPVRDLKSGQFVRGYWPERPTLSLPPLQL